MEILNELLSEITSNNKEMSDNSISYENMKFKALTKKQFQELLNERVTFNYYDGDFWIVSALLENEDSNKNNGLPFKVNITFQEKEGKHLTFFNNDRLKDIMFYIDIVEVGIVSTKEVTAITNFKQ